jgi:hypothetical protein
MILKDTPWRDAKSLNSLKSLAAERYSMIVALKPRAPSFVQ